MLILNILGTSKSSFVVQIMNMYGDLVMDSVPDKVKKLMKYVMRKQNSCKDFIELH